MFNILIFDIRFWTFANLFVQTMIFPSATSVEIPRKTCNFLEKSNQVTWHYKIDCSFPEWIHRGLNLLKVTFDHLPADTIKLNVNVFEDVHGVTGAFITGFTVTQKDLTDNRYFATLVKISTPGSVRIKADYYRVNPLQPKETIYFKMTHFTDGVPSHFGVIGVKPAATEEETSRGSSDGTRTDIHDYTGIVGEYTRGVDEGEMQQQDERDITSILVDLGPEAVSQVMRFVDHFTTDYSDQQTQGTLYPQTED